MGRRYGTFTLSVFAANVLAASAFLAGTLAGPPILASVYAGPAVPASMFAALPALARPCLHGLYLVQERAVLALVDASASAELIATLPAPVNALGYASDQALFYGLSGDRVVTIDIAGSITDLGPAPHAVLGAYAGSISGNRWYVRAHADLYVLGVEPGAASYLTVLQRIPIPGTPMLGDWDFGPGGALYGVDSQGGAQVTRVDVNTGDVTRFPAPGLEPGNSYGAVSVGPDGVMHALHNATGRLYHVPLNNPAASDFTRVGASTQSDAATCPIVWDNSTAPVPYPAAAHRQLPGGSLRLGELVFGQSARTAEVKVRNDTGRPALLAGWLDLLVSRYVPDRWLVADADAASALYATIGMVYAILIAIAAIAAWEPRTAADQSSKREAADLIEAHWQAGALSAVDSLEIRMRIEGYLTEVIRVEWPVLRDSRAASPPVDRSFKALRARVESVKPQDDRQEQAQQEVLARLSDAAGARRERIAAAQEGIPGPLWLILIVSGIVSVGFLYLFGLERTFPNGLMMATVGGMIALLLYVLYQVEYPYSRGLGIGANAFQDALAHLT